MHELTTVKQFFQSIQIPLSDIWLESCINWCKEEKLEANYAISDLQKELYQQWLFLDLRDIETPSLPPNLSTQKHFVINGNYCLQVMKIVDISKPKLSQLHEIRKRYSLTKSAQDGSEVTNGKRMLLLTLSDGVQEVEAMEYRTISTLNVNLSPGVKIRLLGPLTVRRGRIMLEEKHVKVLGGEVEEMLVPNAAENVLATILNLPLNQNPGQIDEREEQNETLQTNQRQGPNLVNPQQANMIRPNNVRSENNILQPIPNNVRTRNVMENNTRQSNPNNVRSQNVMENNTRQSNPNNVRTQNVMENNTRQSNPNNVRTQNAMDIDENRISEEIEMLLEAEREINGNGDIDIDPADFEAEMIPVPTSTQLPAKIKSTPEKLLSQISLDDDIDFFENIDIDAHLDEIDKSKPSTSKTVTISELTGNGKYGIFHVKVKFHSAVEKLTVRDEFRMVIKVEDSTGVLTVKIHSDVISDLCGYSPQAISYLKGDISNKEKVIKAIQKVKVGLCKMEFVAIELRHGGELPTVVAVMDKDKNS